MSQFAEPLRRTLVRNVCLAAGVGALLALQGHSLRLPASARALPLEAPPLGMWWYGGVLLIGVELAVHGLLAVRGRPNFYSGRG